MTRALVVVLALGASIPAAAKELRTQGRTIYGAHEQFGGLLDQDQRTVVAEVAIGNGSEGHLGLVFGWLANRPHGLEIYGGFGMRVGPSFHVTGSTRMFFNLSGWRPYVGAGYLLQVQPNIGMRSHSVFFDVGYKWVVHHTFHVTVSVGFQQMVYAWFGDDSVLRDADVAPEFLEHELDALDRFRPQAAIRFSRAF